MPYQTPHLLSLFARLLKTKTLNYLNQDNPLDKCKLYSRTTYVKVYSKRWSCKEPTMISDREVLVSGLVGLLKTKTLNYLNQDNPLDKCNYTQGPLMSRFILRDEFARNQQWYQIGRYSSVAWWIRAVICFKDGKEKNFSHNLLYAKPTLGHNHFLPGIMQSWKIIAEITFWCRDTLGTAVYGQSYVEMGESVQNLECWNYLLHTRTFWP
jgi:hypothetical protein